MITERKFLEIGSQLVLSNGTQDGQITVPNIDAFKVKQTIVLKSNGVSGEKLYSINRIIAPNILCLGTLKGPITDRVDLTQFLTSDLTTIFAREQERPGIIPDAFWRAVYDEEPTVAIRTTAVDALGNKYSTTNPMPVRLTDGSVNIGTVNAELEVQLSHRDNSPDPGDVADSVRIGDGTNEAQITKSIVGTKTGLNVNSINTVFTKPFTKLTVLTKNDDGDPLTIRSMYATTPVQLATIVYDSDGDFQDVEVSDL